MIDRLALKRLTASDLTFFESLFRSLNVGNQKSINLNADVFIEKFYSSLPGLVGSGVSDRILVSLTVIGPAAAPPYVLSRAITKRDAYKNWRLNGEFIWDPEGQPGRFNILSANDLALIEFSGEPVPQKVSLVLLAQKSTIDAPLHDALAKKIPGGRRTMIEISRQELADAMAGIPAAHPAWAFADDPAFDAALEDAALGGIKGAEEVVKKLAKPVSAETLAAAKASAEKNGRDGEAIVWSYLQQRRKAGTYADVIWVSKANAVAPCDFIAKLSDGTEIAIDAKSTSGEFSNRIHMSIAELKSASVTKRYELWRIYKLSEDGAYLRVSKPIADFSKSVMNGLNPPDGVTVDTVSIDPKVLTWGDEINIEQLDESDGDN